MKENIICVLFFLPLPLFTLFIFYLAWHLLNKLSGVILHLLARVGATRK